MTTYQCQSETTKLLPTIHTGNVCKVEKKLSIQDKSSIHIQIYQQYVRKQKKLCWIDKYMADVTTDAGFFFFGKQQKPSPSLCAKKVNMHLCKKEAMIIKTHIIKSKKMIHELKIHQTIYWPCLPKIVHTHCKETLDQMDHAASLG